jgi:hypothetical protein
MSKHFLFLKITDPEICSVLWELRDIFAKEKRPRTDIHITVRGPNKNPFKSSVIDNLYKKIADDPILIHSADRFDNGKYQVVFMKVESENLHRIWRKPDYPKEKYGVNGHITLYEGTDKVFADCIYNFLKKERLELVCNSFELVSYQSKQIPIPGVDNELVGAGFVNLVDRGRVSLNVLERAKEAVKQCERYIESLRSN